MKNMVMVIIATILSAGFAIQAYSDTNDYNSARYKLILDRAPFGNMAIDNNGIFGTSAYSINNEYRLCLILAEEESGNILAGFENLRSVAGEYKSFILMEGESYNGMTLVDVDLENSLAQVLYEDKIVPFKLVRKNAASATAQLSIGTTFQPNMDFQNPSSPQTIPNISFEF